MPGVSCGTAQLNLSGSFRTLRSHTKDDKLEHGFFVFQLGQLLEPGDEVSGTRNGIDVLEPTDRRPVGIVHTHPGGNPKPSRQDVQVYTDFQLDFGCIVTAESNCCDFLHMTDPERKELAAVIGKTRSYAEAERILDDYRRRGKISRCCTPA
ncbi:MAG: Mov34/MPN/PAD-1 family protein [Euryarchaeota archaeon]|nr:Mov34/MPN/PAD-1 family protein [Euryarchaeota archaeon]MDE1836571.1 Mov34/MPN/PAD-1 family protein [Euryarchaeota archaeon]MDE1879234.1 Mov34/MPN/PAD-1 family protein [Euryarchaeota archaeon]MDE2044541.1 Mov34/MPN/PAD-1 family protein [Thermoplasmata archaeon]